MRKLLTFSAHVIISSALNPAFFLPFEVLHTSGRFAVELAILRFTCVKSLRRPLQQRFPPRTRVMGASESVISKLQQQAPIDQITTVSERTEDTDPILERIQALKIAKPLLRSQPLSEGSLTDILVRKPSSSSNSTIPGSLNPNVLLELFSAYRDWQVEKAKEISQKQEEIENKIETANALAGKLLQRFNYSVSSMRTTAHNLTEVHQLQIEVGELKGRVTEVISNCNTLCKRISSQGPESLRRSAVVPPLSTRDISSTDHFSSTS